MASLVGITVDLALVAGSVLALWGGAQQLVTGSTRIARRVGLSELAIGLTVVAIGTSSPEFAVTIGAALEGNGNVAVGNVVGSNVFNLGFILGGVGLLTGISTDRPLVRRDGPVLVVAAVLVAVFLRDLQLGRIEGIVLFVGLIGYVGYVFRRGRRATAGVRDGSSPESGGDDPDPETGESGSPTETSGDDPPPERDGAGDATTETNGWRALIPGATPASRSPGFSWWDPVRALVGLALIVGGAQLLVSVAVNLARLAGLSEWVIGVTVVAIGTSTPELATSVVAAGRGRAGLSAGSLVGSDLFNLLGVLGVTALIQPVTVEAGAVTAVAWMVGAVVLAVALLATGERLSRIEGALLVSVSVVRWAWDLFP